MGKNPVTRPSRTERLKNNQLISKYHAKLNSQDKGALEDLGGFEAYQSASLYGTKFGDTSKWLLKEIKPYLEIGRAYSLLDVGALAHNYEGKKWIKTEAIDLHPRLPGIKRANFLNYQCDELKDIVCLSLVINFCGDPVDRGKMLIRARDVLKDDGFIYIVLPNSCVFHSRFITQDYFKSLLSTTGFVAIKEHVSRKLYYCLARKAKVEKLEDLSEPNLKVNGYNNFKIRLP